MSNFNYVTGYLPYVIDEEIHKKKIKQRVIFGLAALATGFIVFSLLGNDTSAQSNKTQYLPENTITHPASEAINGVNPVKLATVKKEKAAIETSQKPVVLHKTTVSKQSDKQADAGKKIVESTQSLEKVYNKEVENILNKAFSQ